MAVLHQARITRLSSRPEVGEDSAPDGPHHTNCCTQHGCCPLIHSDILWPLLDHKTHRASESLRLPRLR